MDDLKANFRSYEYDCDNADDTNILINELCTRHPEVRESEVREIAAEWTRYSENI
jgi:hypothetical protein